MSNIVQESRILIKRSTIPGEVPTIPTSTEHTDGTWLSTDIYEGELFINVVDEKVWFRGETIQQIYPAGASASQDVFLYNDLASFPVSGTVDKIYIAKDTSNGYWWDSALLTYVLLSSTASVSWLSITGGPTSTPTQIDDAVDLSHDINAPNTSHYTKLESDAVAGASGAKVDKVDGYGLSQNDFTDAYKAILDAGISQVVIENTKAEFPIPGSLSVAYFARVDKQIWLWDDGIIDYTQLYDGIIDELSELTDVGLTGVADGQILKYNSSTSKWENATNQLGELVDVNLVGLTDGQILQYNATTTKWGNVDLTSGGIGGSIAEGQVAFGNASAEIAGSNNFTWDNTDKTLKTNGRIYNVAKDFPTYKLGVQVDSDTLSSQSIGMGFLGVGKDKANLWSTDSDFYVSANSRKLFLGYFDLNGTVALSPVGIRTNTITAGYDIEVNGDMLVKGLIHEVAKDVGSYKSGLQIWSDNSTSQAMAFGFLGTSKNKATLWSGDSDMFLSSGNSSYKTYLGYFDLNGSVTLNPVGLRTSSITSGFDIDIVGNTLIQGTTSGGLTIKGGDALGATKPFVVNNSSNSEVFNILDNGSFSAGAGKFNYNNTSKELIIADAIFVGYTLGHNSKESAIYGKLTIGGYHGNNGARLSVISDATDGMTFKMATSLNTYAFYMYDSGNLHLTRNSDSNYENLGKFTLTANTGQTGLALVGGGALGATNALSIRNNANVPVFDIKDDGSTEGTFLTVKSDVVRIGSQVSGGSYSIGLGFRPLYNTTGAYNIGIGYQGGSAITTGTYNIAIGHAAMYNGGVTGSYNTALGMYSGASLTTGSLNLMLGQSSGYNTTTGQENTFVGMQTGISNYTGSYNTYIGRSAGYNATGSVNVFIGNSAGYSETGSNKLYIANSNTATPLIYGEFDNALLRINGNLEVRDTDAVHLGNKDVDGTWKFVRSGNDLLIQRRESGVYVTKSTITA